MSISANEFADLCPHLNAATRGAILPPLQAAMTRFEITTSDREAHFLAQVCHESGAFKYRRELASGAAYEGRRDLGNTQPGDGRRYRGRGWIQVTGRANYRTYGRKIGVDIEAHPELAETNENAPLIAAAYWDGRNLNAKADRNDLIGITKAINGGLNGLADRRFWLSRARAVLSLNDPDPSEDDGDTMIPLLLRGQELPFSGHLEDDSTWAPLRPLCNALGLTILSTDDDEASIVREGGLPGPVMLRIDGGRGFSPVRQVAFVAGLRVTFDGKRVEIG